MSTAEILSDTPASPLGSTKSRGRQRLGVFGDNRLKPFHRWYPFVEGYSADLVGKALNDTPDECRLLDPFGGSGTTALAAAQLGYDCSFCEVNPYLAWVADVKVNQSRIAFESQAQTDLLRLADVLEATGVGSTPSRFDHPFVEADSRRSFFAPGVAAAVVHTLGIAEELCRPAALGVARLAIATSLIPASNMIRRTDLRRRRAGDPEPQLFAETVIGRLRGMASDIESEGSTIRGRATHLAADARTLSPVPDSVDLIVTSPPYLNGTNYCRNTKLELLALGFVSHESELGDLRLSSIAAGINNISARRSEPEVVPAVEAVATALDQVAYDRRIPAMVRMYFSDMRHVFASVRANAHPGTRWLLDIGDSRFSGVHVPTPDLLGQVAALAGWRLVRIDTLRSRRSHDGSQLTQVLLELEAV